MSAYDFASIEKKWQAHWESRQTFRQPNPGEGGFQDRPRYYVLDMFPYPSGAGLHVGHPEGYTATDIVARYRRMKGFNVLHPMGYDAFGLPAQQYAVEHGIHPRVTTERNIANIERQIKMLGFSYDWSRRLATTDEDYYRWTQWIFLQMHNAWYDPQARAARPIGELVSRLQNGQLVIGVDGQIKPMAGWRKIPDLSLMTAAPGELKFYQLEKEHQREIIDSLRLAYLDEVPVNWCPALGTVLANEEVTNEGRSERGDHPVYRRALKQWMLRITAYAERLLDDLKLVDWPESIQAMQRNWIGKSEGAEVAFPLESVETPEWFDDQKNGGFIGDQEGVIVVYTTRPDTLYGATYMVLAPEHPLVEEITTPERKQAVEAYVRESSLKSELERTAEAKEKTGAFTGAYAINPVTKGSIPIWVADYVLMGYGTGAIMAVPAHDTRDLEFARKFDLPIVQVVQPPAGQAWEGFVGDGSAVNSGPYDGMPTAEFKNRVTADLEKAGLGKGTVNYKLRDWIFSRQWYWGEPFPIIHCENCGTVGVPESDLPVRLPDMRDFQPHASDDPSAPPQPPLGRATDWVAVKCPYCGGPASRETNAMPQWAGSCWYYLRYLDPKNDKRFCDPEIEKYWMGGAGDSSAASGKDARPARGGVDLYVGGAEHAVLHLLYARFWHKVLFDLGHVSTPEPFRRLFNQGMIRSFAYRDRRGIYVAYDQIDFSGDKPRLKATGEELAESVEKMSKSLKNVVNPDDAVTEYGADTFRLYEMFMGPLEASKPWNTRDVAGVSRFLNRVWRMIVGDEDQKSLLCGRGSQAAPPEIEKSLNRLIKKAGEDIEAMKFNTAIAAMMEFVNAVYRAGAVGTSQAERFVLVLAPFAPHVAEELWERLGHGESLAHEPWPQYDPALIAEETLELAVQVCGKVRARITVPASASRDDALAAAKADPKVAAALAGKTVVKEIFVAGRLVNFVAT
jgi:leucyl-tRNA synthetase